MIAVNKTVPLGFALSFFASGDYKILTTYYASIDIIIGELEFIGIITTKHQESFG